MLFRRRVIPFDDDLQPRRRPAVVVSTARGHGGPDIEPVLPWKEIKNRFPLLVVMAATVNEWANWYWAEPAVEFALTQRFSTGSSWVTNRQEIEQLLEWAASQRLQVTLLYKHVVDGKEVRNRVDPYSYRYRRSQAGPGVWKFFFGYHPAHGTIEQYLVANIEAARVTGKRYAERWPVELEREI